MRPRRSLPRGARQAALLVLDRVAPGGEHAETLRGSGPRDGAGKRDAPEPPRAVDDGPIAPPPPARLALADDELAEVFSAIDTLNKVLGLGYSDVGWCLAIENDRAPHVTPAAPGASGRFRDVSADVISGKFPFWGSGAVIIMFAEIFG